MADSQEQPPQTPLSSVFSSPPNAPQLGLERGRSTCNLGARLDAAAEQSVLDGSGGDEETPEEEPVTDDEMVTPIVIDYQDNETVQILSDDECVMSPQKPKEPLADHHPGNPGCEEKIAEQVTDNEFGEPPWATPTRLKDEVESGKDKVSPRLPDLEIKSMGGQDAAPVISDQSAEAKPEVPAEATKTEDMKEEKAIREDEEDKLNSEEEAVKDHGKSAVKKETTKGTFKAEKVGASGGRIQNQKCLCRFDFLCLWLSG